MVFLGGKDKGLMGGGGSSDYSGLNEHIYFGTKCLENGNRELSLQQPQAWTFESPVYTSLPNHSLHVSTLHGTVLSLLQALDSA